MTSHYEALGFTLVHFCWQAMALAALYRLIEFLAPRMRSQTRYALGLGLMLAMLVMAGVTFIFEEARLAAQSDIAVAAPFLPAASNTLTLAALLPWLDAAWIAGVVILSLRMAGGLWFISRLSRSAQIVPEGLANRFVHATRRLGLAGKVRLRLHPAISGPFVIGAFRSVIYLPASALTALAPEQLDAVLAHELEHIRRADYLWNLVQSLIETLFFFHPAVWWLGARLREQRELCCDDAALATCPDPLTYATALLSLEEQRRAGPRLAMALNGEGSGKSLISRIARMLGEKTSLPRGKARPTAALALPIVLIALAVFVTPVARVAASVQQDIGQTMGLTPATDDKKACPVKTKAFKAKLAAIKADRPGISDDDAVMIAKADKDFADYRLDRDVDLRDIDPDAIAAQVRAEVERSHAEIARAKAENIDPDAIAEQARQGAQRAKAEMESKGWASQIDPDAIAANARAAAENARANLANLKDVDIDADAIAAQARAGIIAAKASYVWTDGNRGWKHHGLFWKAPKAPKPPKTPWSLHAPTPPEVPAPLMDAPTPPTALTPSPPIVAPVAPMSPVATPPAPPTPPTGASLIMKKVIVLSQAPVAMVTPAPRPKAKIDVTVKVRGNIKVAA